MMLGLLLARAGIEVAVLEKHADFFRDFRGDTIHPSTLQIMDELGLLDGLLTIPHSEISVLSGRIGDEMLKIADFRDIPGRCKFIAFMPQWDFLTFLAGQARRYPTFHLEMKTEAIDLLRDGGRITGVIAQTPNGKVTINADLTIAADGRTSTLRNSANVQIMDLGAPIDVLWLRLSKKPDDPGQTFGNIAPGGILVAIDRRDYYQCAFVIQKGGFTAIQARGIEAFRETVATLAPFLRDRVTEIEDWNDVKLLTVRVDRLKQWYLPGLLCIGDAAHAMSPIGGVGINLAIQDAVAAANILAEPLRDRSVTTNDLRAVQRRRELPTRLTQALQVQMQNRVVNRVLSTREKLELPSLLRLLLRMRLFNRMLARIVGFGFRREHIRTPERPLSC